MYRILIVFLLCLIGGCGEGEPSGKNVALDKVPDPVMKVAKEKLPNVEFDQAWTRPNGNYEVRGKTKEGKVRDIQIKPSGEVVEID